MAGQNLYDERMRDAAPGPGPHPGRYRLWFLALLMVWWLAGCVALARGGVSTGALVLWPECALVLALDHPNALTLHRLLPWRLRSWWGRLVAALFVFTLAPVMLALYLAIAARHVWSGAARAEVAVPLAPASPIPPTRGSPPQIEAMLTTPLPSTPAAFRAEDGPSRHRRTALLVGSGALAALLLATCAFAAMTTQSGPLASLLGPSTSSGAIQITGGPHHTASTGQGAQRPGTSATATIATTTPPTATATTITIAPTTSVQPTTPSTPGNGSGASDQGTAGAQSPAPTIAPTMPATPASPSNDAGNTATNKDTITTAAQLAAAERTLPTIYVPSLAMTFSCADSSAGTAFCVRGQPGTGVTIALSAECVSTGGQLTALTRERTVGDSGVLRWNWQPTEPCARGFALADITTPDGQHHRALAVTRDPPTLP